MLSASRIFLGALAAGVSWARLGAGSHYPSHVLDGVATGRFIGTFINGAFLGIEKSSLIMPIIEPSLDGGLIGITIRYP